MQQPFISVITPTYNRRQFIPTLIEIYKNQTYSKDKMEWIILDDGSDRVEDLFIEAAKKIPNIRYIYNSEKKTIGAKRNRLNEEAKGDIIVAMDDDDYYPPTKIASIVTAFNKNPKINLAGSSQMYLYYTSDKKIYSVGPYNPNHATNGTMSYRKVYSKKNKYNEYVTHAEEMQFLENYKNPMIQIDPRKAILVICHTDNTFDKEQLRVNDKYKDNPLFKGTSLKLRDFVGESKIREFYSQL